MHQNFRRELCCSLERIAAALLQKVEDLKSFVLRPAKQQRWAHGVELLLRWTLAVQHPWLQAGLFAQQSRLLVQAWRFVLHNSSTGQPTGQVSTSLSRVAVC